MTLTLEQISKDLAGKKKLIGMDATKENENPRFERVKVFFEADGKSPKPLENPVKFYAERLD